MLVFKDKPDGRVDRRFNKKLFAKDKKKYLLIANRRHGTIRQLWKSEFMMFEESTLTS